VLISPNATGKPDWAKNTISVRITKEQVNNSLNINIKKSISRQHENAFLCYNCHPIYRGGTELRGAAIDQNMTMPGYSSY
jgi:hypothetical protein